MGRNIRKGISGLNISGQLTAIQEQDLLKLISRVMEDSYRRGVQQAITLKECGEFNCDVLKLRHSDSLDKSPRLETGKPMGGTYSSSLYRLVVEYDAYLVDSGFDPDFIHAIGR